VGPIEGDGHQRCSSAAEERGCSNDSGSFGNRRRSARAPTSSGKKGKGEAHRN
jgi:hypothetical protein